MGGLSIDLTLALFLLNCVSKSDDSEEFLIFKPFSLVQRGFTGYRTEQHCIVPVTGQSLQLTQKVSIVLTTLA